jgi:mRNA interferase MazF
VICNFGTVAIVPFPFVELTVTKYRPSVVLSNEAFNASNGQTVLAMITTAKESSWPTDLAIKDIEAAGLAQPCYVRWKIFTLPNEIILRTAGQFTKRDARATRSALNRALS